jgi:hypothetical protein
MAALNYHQNKTAMLIIQYGGFYIKASLNS